MQIIRIYETDQDKSDAAIKKAVRLVLSWIPKPEAETVVPVDAQSTDKKPAQKEVTR